MTILPSPTGSRADDIRSEVKSLLMVLIDLADYSREDLRDIVEDAIENTGDEETR